MFGALVKHVREAMLPREPQLEEMVTALLGHLPRCACGSYAAHVTPQDGGGVVFSCTRCFRHPKIGWSTAPALRFASEALAVEALLVERRTRVAIVNRRDAELRQMAVLLIAALPQCACHQPGSSLFYGMWLCTACAQSAVPERPLPQVLDIAPVVRRVERVLEG